MFNMQERKGPLLTRFPVYDEAKNVIAVIKLQYFVTNYVNFRLQQCGSSTVNVPSLVFSHVRWVSFTIDLTPTAPTRTTPAALLVFCLLGKLELV